MLKLIFQDDLNAPTTICRVAEVPLKISQLGKNIGGLGVLYGATHFFHGIRWFQREIVQ